MILRQGRLDARLFARECDVVDYDRSMLAERTRIVGLVTAVGLVIATAGAICSEREEPIERLSVDVRVDLATPEMGSNGHEDAISCSRHRPPLGEDTLFVVLRDEPEWTGVEEESDWARSYHMVWDGPIRTWTTMRKVRVPGLDHRMIESIEPVGTEHHAVFVRVRVVVPGDLEAALEWVRARPEVESASVRLEYEY